MDILRTLDALRGALPDAGRCALVPTMGNLHDGHLALVAAARATGLPVVVSVFVNRLQFGPSDDFDRYPRTFEDDCRRLAAAGCDHVFAPDEAVLYPVPQTFRISPDPALADILEGAARPGFFGGVCTVVMKLFCCVRPAVAVFGKKDYQQVRVLATMARQFALPIELLAVDTVRAADGLALSSRNGYLSAGDRARAAGLHAELRRLIDDYRTDPAALTSHEAAAEGRLAAAGWQPDYLTIRRRDDLATPDPSDRALVALGAARLGDTRLIDNLEFDGPPRA